jgi:Coenzyme PQQ synthesis protein D (PqqD)
MSPRGDRFRIKGPGVVSDVIDGETIGINLDTGDYYSLPGVASEIWEMVRRRLPVERIVQAIRDGYEGDAAVIEAAVIQFIQRLSDAALVVRDEGEPPAVDDLEPERPRKRRPFAPPALETYSDMREFLLVDPIHEVDVTEWPRVQRRDVG